MQKTLHTEQVLHLANFRQLNKSDKHIIYVAWKKKETRLNYLKTFAYHSAWSLFFIIEALDRRLGSTGE